MCGLTAATKALAKKVWPQGLPRPAGPNRGAPSCGPPPVFAAPSTHKDGAVGGGSQLWSPKVHLRQLCWKSMLEEPWVTPRRAPPTLPPNLQGAPNWGGFFFAAPSAHKDGAADDVRLHQLDKVIQTSTPRSSISSFERSKSLRNLSQRPRWPLGQPVMICCVS